MYTGSMYALLILKWIELLLFGIFCHTIRVYWMPVVITNTVVAYTQWYIKTFYSIFNWAT